MSNAYTTEWNTKRVNGNYKIIKSEYYNNRNEIVLAILQAGNGNITSYVTWECINEEDYFWGHYFTDYNSAMKDYHTRLAHQYDIILNR